jgi:preprotein translocase subunit YajC
MLANDLKKGDRIVMTNGWAATIEDNKRGNIRMATVEGYATEMGSIYIWDIQGVVLTAAQAKAKGRVNAWGF